MQYLEQAIKGVFIIEPVRFKDERGYFCETYKKEEFDKNVGVVNFVQDNESFSAFGVVRGLHFQSGEYSQAKLVRVSRGSILDVGVDLRKDSPTFGKHIAVELSEENGRMLFLPRGFAHGFVVLSKEVQFQYKVDNVYAPQSEHTLKFDDVEIGIDWRLTPDEMVLSPKDLNGIELKNIKTCL